MQLAEKDKTQNPILELKQSKGKQWKLVVTDLKEDSDYLITATFIANRKEIKKKGLNFHTGPFEKKALHKFDFLALGQHSNLYRPAINGNKLVTTDNSSPMLSFDLEKGTLQTFSSKEFCGPAFCWRDRIVVVVEGIELHCHDLFGKELWNRTLKKRVPYRPLFL